MKYYNFETVIKWLANKIGDYLRENNIYFEISENGRYYHFEILTDAAGAAVIDDQIDYFRNVEEA